MGIKTMNLPQTSIILRNTMDHLPTCKCDCFARRQPSPQEMQCEDGYTEGPPPDKMCNIKVGDLVKGMEYPIKRLRFAYTKYGRKVIADLKNGESLFLPSKFDGLTYTDVQLMSRTPHSLYYYGRRKTMDNEREYNMVEINPSPMGWMPADWAPHY